MKDFGEHMAINAALQDPGSNLSRLYTFMDASSGAMHANTFKEPCAGQPQHSVPSDPSDPGNVQCIDWCSSRCQ